MGVSVDGYAWAIPLELRDDDYDMQGHLNNAAVARHCNDLRMAYVRANFRSRWINWLREREAVVVAREVHLSFLSEGLPGESFVGATRITRRDGRATIVEQRIAEAVTGRVVADAWVVQLLVIGGAVADWPEFYWDLAAATEGHEIPQRAVVERVPFGPPPWPDNDSAESPA